MSCNYLRIGKFKREKRRFTEIKALLNRVVRKGEPNGPNEVDRKKDKVVGHSGGN